MKVMKDLVGSCNVYLGEGVANARLLELIGLYLTDMMKIFGVVPESTRFGFPVDQQTMDEVYCRPAIQTAALTLYPPSLGSYCCSVCQPASRIP